MVRGKILENVAEAWQPARIDNKKELTIIDAIEQVCRPKKSLQDLTQK